LFSFCYALPVLLITTCFSLHTLLGQAHILSSYVHILLLTPFTRRLGLGPILPSLLLETMCKLFDLMILLHKLIEYWWKFIWLKTSWIWLELIWNLNKMKFEKGSWRILRVHFTIFNGMKLFCIIANNSI